MRSIPQAHEGDVRRLSGELGVAEQPSAERVHRRRVAPIQFFERVRTPLGNLLEKLAVGGL
jgi:hypothetical protein